MMRKTFLTSALDMPEIMSYIYNKSWKLQFSASSSIIIIEDFYLQTFLHSLFFASLWFASCLALADFNQPTLKLIIQLYTAFLFIFDACIIPDFLSSIDPQKNKNECVSNELKEKIEKLEKEIEELKKFEKKTD